MLCLVFSRWPLLYAVMSHNFSIIICVNRYVRTEMEREVQSLMCVLFCAFVLC